MHHTLPDKGKELLTRTRAVQGPCPCWPVSQASAPVQVTAAARPFSALLQLPPFVSPLLAMPHLEPAPPEASVSQACMWTPHCRPHRVSPEWEPEWEGGSLHQARLLAQKALLVALGGSLA